eukprot:scaffold3361_cov153-Isochrysis_galbana.AAC.4
MTQIQVYRGRAYGSRSNIAHRSHVVAPTSKTRRARRTLAAVRSVGCPTGPSIARCMPTGTTIPNARRPAFLGMPCAGED